MCRNKKALEILNAVIDELERDKEGNAFSLIRGHVDSSIMYNKDVFELYQYYGENLELFAAVKQEVRSGLYNEVFNELLKSLNTRPENDDQDDEGVL